MPVRTSIEIHPMFERSAKKKVCRKSESISSADKRGRKSYSKIVCSATGFYEI